MIDKQQQLDILRGENFSEESGLSRANKRIISKMFSYIQKFPLEEIAVEQIRKDIIGMAEEAEQRGEDFNSVIGNDRKEFCNQLISAMTEYEFPKGMRLLKIAGFYYRFQRYYYTIFCGAVPLFTIIPLIFARQGEETRDIIISSVAVVINIVVGIISGMAGDRAWNYSNDASKADVCLKWGFGLLFVRLLAFVFNYILNIRMTIPTIYLIYIGRELTGWTIGALVFHLFWVGLYIIGARKNKVKKVS